MRAFFMPGRLAEAADKALGLRQALERAKLLAFRICLRERCE